MFEGLTNSFFIYMELSYTIVAQVFLLHLLRQGVVTMRKEKEDEKKPVCLIYL